MAVTIKLKNASGSDPSASDLVVGEVAIRTDNGKLFTKKDNGSVAEITGGGGIDDGDKGDITVSNSGGTFTIDDGVVTTAKIADDAITAAKIATNTITNAEIAANTIGTGVLAANAVITDRINNAAVTTAKLADDAVTGAKIADDSIDSEHYVDGSIDTAHIADDAVTGAKIGHSTVAAVNLQTDAVETAKILNDAVTFAKIQNIAQNKFAGRISSGTGNLEQLTAANVRSIINVEDGATADQSASEIKTAYESNSDTNAFTDALLSKLNGIAASATNVTNNNQLTNGAGFITATLTNEQVQDIVGGMVSGNTETGITVTYQDGDGTLDFVVGTLNQDTTGNAATATSLETARTIGGVSFNGTANINLPGVNTAGNQNTSGTSGGFTAGNASNLNSGTIPDARFPSTLPAVDGSNLTGISAGATGGGSDEVFYENDQTVTTNYTITNGKNAMSAGPITINSGVTVTVGDGETLTIV